MKKLYLLLVLSISILSISAQAPKNFHSFKAATIQGDTINLKKYYGKKVLVVNTASFCSYTYEFAHLQTLYNQYKKYNFEIIGFPCNDFGSQDPNSDSIIFTFCTDNYGVTFQMMSRIAIVSHDTADVYKWLMRKDLNGVKNAAVDWNFNKFMIDEAGNWVGRLASPVNPLDTAITNWILRPSVLPPNTIYTTEQPLTTDAQATFAQQSIPTDINNNEANTATEITIRDNGSGHFYLTVGEYKKFSASIYSIDGRHVAALYEGPTTDKQSIWFATDILPAGTYIISTVADAKQKSIKYAVTK